MKNASYDDDHMKRFIGKIARKKERIISSRGDGDDPYAWLKITGIIGWSVIIPALLGIGAGLWMERRFDTGFPFTLILMLSGLTAGCINAWRMIGRIINRK